MDFASFQKIVTARAEALGLTEYELYYQQGSSTSVSAFGHEIREFSAEETGGVCFRCIADGKMGYASTQSLSESEAEAIVSRAMDNASILETEEAVFLCPGGQEYTPIDRENYTLPDTETLIRTVLDTQEKLYAADPAVIDGCESQVIADRTRIAIVNSKGLDLHYDNAYCAVVTAAVVTDGTEKADDYEIRAGKLEDMDTGAMAKKAAAAALQKLGGGLPATGKCPVIFAGEAVASLLAAFSGVFSAESANKGLSRFKGAEGTMVASPAVTLVDDPFHPDSPAPRNFDGEGSPTRCKAVIENGRLTTLLHNLKTAAQAGIPSTGNASKAGYTSPVAIRPFTMYVANGEYTEEELLEKAQNGVYITSLQGLHAGANPISGDFSLQSSGFLIENGKKTAFVKSFTVAGNFYTLLGDVTAAADNCRIINPMGVTAFGSPSLLCDGLTVAGA